MDIPLPSDPPILGGIPAVPSVPEVVKSPQSSPVVEDNENDEPDAATEPETDDADAEVPENDDPSSPQSSSSPPLESSSPQCLPDDDDDDDAAPDDDDASPPPPSSSSILDEIEAPLPPLPPDTSVSSPLSSSAASPLTVSKSITTSASSKNEQVETDSHPFSFDTSSIMLDSIELPASAPALLPPPPLPSAVLLADFTLPSHADIPMPEDPNRYSPSLPIDDDPPPLPQESNTSSNSTPSGFDFPSAPPLPAGPPPPAVPRSIVLGRQQAKKRLLAFSMTKQGGGAGLSFALPKKSPVLSKDASKMFSSGGVGTAADADGKKKLKKPKETKARGTIEEIEELKRQENEVREALLREAMMREPRLGQSRGSTAEAVAAAAAVVATSVPAGALSEQTVSGPENRSGEFDTVVDDLLAKRQRKKKYEDEERERRLKRKEEREKRKKRMKTLPTNWGEFNKDKHRVYHFRRFKYEVEKQNSRHLKDDKRRRRSRDRRSRSRDRDHKSEKKEQTMVAPGGRINLLDTPMVVRKILVALEAHGNGQVDIEFPEYLIRYTKTKPPLTYCENPKIATYHLQNREEMLATVPPDIEEIIYKFLHSIMPKR